MKKRYAIGIMASCLIIMAGCKKEASTRLDTYTVEPTEINEIVTATGTMESVTQVDVGTQVTGIISKLYADYNDHVEKGQLIAEIEKTLLESELKSANANMESAKATYEYTKKNYLRDKALHDEGLISDYEFQTSEKEYIVAKTAYEKSQADIVKAAKNLNYAEIYSPIDGIIVSREVEVGQTVVSSMNVANLYVIADLDNMQVVGNVDEADIGKVKVGQKVTFTVDSYTDDIFNGTVTQVRLNPTTTSNVVTYEVIVETSNPDHKLIPGMTANLTIYTTQLSNVLAIPLKAMKFTPEMPSENSGLPVPDGEAKQPSDPNQSNVWVVKGDKLVPTLVTLGTSNGIYREVLSGLKNGDIVALQYMEIAGNEDKGTTEENPFMPKRPGSNKNKGNK